MAEDLSSLSEDDLSRLLQVIESLEHSAFDFLQLEVGGMKVVLGKGSPAAAAQVLQRAANAEPESRSIREALARAQFDTGQYEEAAANFRAIVEAAPTDDYANFGLGLALARRGDHEAAAEYLALAVAMRPDREHYTDALRQVRATLKFRRQTP